MQKLIGQQCTLIRHIGIGTQRCDICSLHFLIKQWSPTLMADHWSIHWLYRPLSMYSFTCMTMLIRQRPVTWLYLAPCYCSHTVYPHSSYKLWPTIWRHTDRQAMFRPNISKKQVYCCLGRYTLVFFWARYVMLFLGQSINDHENGVIDLSVCLAF